MIPNAAMGFPLRTPEPLGRPSDRMRNYEASLFLFWITRPDPHASPLFVTRISSLPKIPISAIILEVVSTSLGRFPLVSEDRYLQVCINSVPQYNSLACSVAHLRTPTRYQHLWFRRSCCQQRVQARYQGGPGHGSVQTMWTRDRADPIGENRYVYSLYSRRAHPCLKRSSGCGSHPVHLEHRFNEDVITPRSRSVYLHR